MPRRPVVVTYGLVPQNHKRADTTLVINLPLLSSHIEYIRFKDVGQEHVAHAKALLKLCQTMTHLFRTAVPTKAREGPFAALGHMAWRSQVN